MYIRKRRRRRVETKAERDLRRSLLSAQRPVAEKARSDESETSTSLPESLSKDTCYGRSLCSSTSAHAVVA